MDGIVDDDATQLCTYCHLLAKPGKKLKRCSRCRNAWYHNAECQRNDYPSHKHVCQKRIEAKVSEEWWDSTVVVVERDGRGKCLVARQDITKLNRISPRNGWHPLVAPVLGEQYRTSRCAFCFSSLTEHLYFYDSIHPNPLYRLLFCSSSCRDIAASEHQMDHEERAIHKLFEANYAPPKILSTAILLYRIIWKQMNIEIRSKIEQFQSAPQQESQSMGKTEDDHSTYHTQAVIATVMGMFQYSDSTFPSNMEHLSLEYLSKMIQRIKINAFSIYDGVFVCYGFGLYHPGNFMNHSCRPNALQTFLFQESNCPTLHVTAFDDIVSNQEICISYVDTCCPIHIRHQQLNTNYFFDCRCDECCNISDDAKKMGIHCLSCMKGPVLRTATVMGPTPPAAIYICEQCGSTDFGLTMRLLSSFEQYINLELKNRPVEQVFKFHKQLKQKCTMSSWYVHEAGEEVLQSYLDKLSQLRGDQSAGEQESAWDALKLAEELLEGARSDARPTTSEFLRLLQLQYKTAKLRLFVAPDPYRSIVELQEVLASLTPYYPPNHDHILGLQATLQGALNN
jgi:hypothetical protein